MRDDRKGKRELNDELATLRRRVAALEKSEARRKRVEQALRESEERFRLFMEHSYDGVNICECRLSKTSARRKLLYCNKRFVAMSGRTRKALMACSNLNKLVIPRTSKEQQAANSECLRQGLPFGGVSSWRRPDGKENYHEWVAVPLKIKGRLYLMGIDRDVTQQRQADRALRESEAKYRELVQNANSIILRMDTKGVVRFFNEFAQAFFGYTEEEILGKNTVGTIVPERDSSGRNLRAMIEDIGRHPDRYASNENENMCRDGRRVWIAWTNEGVFDEKGKITEILCVGNDITARKKAEEELERHREHLEELVDERTAELRARHEQVQEQMAELRRVEQALEREHDLMTRIMETSPVGITVVNKRGRIIFANAAAERTLGLAQDEMAKRSYNAREWRITDFNGKPFPKEGLPFQLVMRSGKPVFDVRHAIEHSDGRRVFLSINAAPFFDDAGKVDGMVATVEDVTERRRAEEALRESEQQHRTTLDAMGDAIHVVDSDLRILLLNAAFRNWTEELGLESNVIGRTVFEVFPFLAKSVREEYRQVFEEGKVRVTEERTRLGDREFLTETRKIPILEGDRVVRVITVVRDVTKHKQMEEELLTARKLESLGILAGGIAHDFNNILTGVLGNVSIAKALTKEGSKLFERLTAAENASVRAKELTRQLLTFSKGGAPLKRVAALGRGIREAALFSLSGSLSRCEFSIPDDLWLVEVDEGQIDQVINNMVINASQAMPEGGVVRIRAENCALAKDHPLPMKEGNYVKIVISDDGIGIPRDHIPKIFDPYFTTKREGSGLGLATCYSIIANHDGHIDVESQVGVGTTFTIYLPASDKAQQADAEPADAHIPGKGRILVMDDDPIVRDVVREMLHHMGYTVVFARTGREAIHQYVQAREQGMAFDAVILDLVIPGGMGGRETLQELLRIDPDAKAIVSSGYSNDPVMSEFERYGFKGVIAKPLELSELSRTVRRILAQKGE